MLLKRKRMPNRARPRKVQTTLRLPGPLYTQAKSLVEKGACAAETLNDFFVTAVRAYVRLLERRRIDAAFRGMAEDTAYQREAQLIAEEIEASDWEALETAEREARERNATR